MERDHLESPEGEIITPEEGAELSEAARVDEGATDIDLVLEFVCDDGSGTFVLKTHSRLDFAEPESQQGNRTWDVEGGTGDYGDLSGSGEASRGSSAVVVVYVGEVRAG